jgi:kynurenine formamidase
VTELSNPFRRPDSPRLSNWGAFGDDDELGTLNFLTPQAVLRGTAAVRTGVAFPLNLPCDQPTSLPLGRPAFSKGTHLLNFENGEFVVNDDHITLSTQGSSQWDAFIHAGFREPGVKGVFYNGLDTDVVDERGYAHRGGIDKIAQRGIAGRGVLLDIARVISGGSPTSLDHDHVIDADEVRACLEHENLIIERGDIVCIRTGWTEEYMDGDSSRRIEMMRPVDGSAGPRTPGISSSVAPLAWEQGWAAVTADNLAVGATPTNPPRENVHVVMLRNLGLPFGELFYFRDLAAECWADQRWEFLFVAVPLWIPGGMGSPSNAMAVR